MTLAAELAADGSVINASIRMIEPRNAPDGRFQQAFEAGRRALIRCSPYDSAAGQVRPVAQHRSRLQPRGNGVMVDRLRRNLLIGVPAAALLARPFAAAAQAPLRIEITEGVIEPMPFAAPGFVPDSRAGGRPRGADHPGGGRRPDRHRALPRDPALGAHRADLELRRAGGLRRLEGDQRAGADHRGGGDERRPGAGALPALGRLRAAGARRGAAVRGRRGQLAAAGAQGGGRGLFPADRRERLLRQQGRVHRRERAEGGAAQAARDHGLRRGERGDADRRQRAGADAAAVAERRARCSTPATSRARRG